MAASWRQTTLGEIGDIVTGKTPPSVRAEYFSGHIPFVTPSDFDGRRKIDATVRSLSESGAASVGRVLVPPNAVMVSCIGSDMGKAAMSTFNCVTNQQINSLIVGPDADPQFVYYDLSRRKEEIRRVASGSAQPILNKSAFGRLTIFLPPLPEQRAIASILEALDDKIELNRKMSATLEAIARAMFKSWFVDFDPVRARAEGRDPGLSAEIAALFPDSFEESEHRDIPSGWSSACVGDYATLDKGLSYKGQYLSADGMPMVNLACFTGDGMFDAERVKGYSGEYKSRHVIKDGDLVLANTDITQKRLVLGSPGIVSLSTAVDALFTHHTYALRFFEDSDSMRYFFYHAFLQDRFRDRAKGYATGTTVLALPTDAILKYEVVLPTTKVRAAFDDLNVPLRARQRIADREARTLKALRDALLPKLISGELRVGEADILAASA